MTHLIRHAHQMTPCTTGDTIPLVHVTSKCTVCNTFLWNRVHVRIQQKLKPTTPLNTHHYHHWMSSTVAHLHEQNIRFYGNTEFKHRSKIEMLVNGKGGVFLCRMVCRCTIFFNTTVHPTQTPNYKQTKHTKGILLGTTAAIARYWWHLRRFRTSCLPPSCECGHVICGVILCSEPPFHT